MKVGSMVKFSRNEHYTDDASPVVSWETGLVIKMTKKKCWRTATQGKKIKWEDIDPEPHVVVMHSKSGNIITVPTTDVEVIYETR